VFEKLKGHVESYGGFLRLMRRSNSLTYDTFNSQTTTTSTTSTTTIPTAPTPTKPIFINQRFSEDGLSKEVMDKLSLGSTSSTEGVISPPCSNPYSPPQQEEDGLAMRRTPPTKKLVGALRKSPATGAGSSQAVKKARKVNFEESVRVVRIPSHKEYSSRVRDSYWTSAEEIYEMACRNLVEFDMEGHDWENVAEETQMIWCEDLGMLVHPAHFDWSEQEP